MDGFSTWLIRVFICTAISITPGYSSQSSTGSDRSSCSRYEFRGVSHNWSDSREKCKTQGGDLVSMETVEEWKFINTQIQNKSTDDPETDEWWIGLVMRDGEWTWLTNYSLTYDKWQPGEPSAQGEVEEYALIAKNFPADTYGLFNDARCSVWRGWICEYENKGCNSNEVTWCKKAITTTTTVATERTTQAGKEEKTLTIKTTETTNPKIQTTTTRVTTAVSIMNKPRTNLPTSLTTTPSNKQAAVTGHQGTTISSTNDSNMGKTTKPANNSLPTLIVVPVLVVGVLVFFCCITFFVCRWKLKQTGKQNTRRKIDDTNAEQNTGDVMTGSTSVLYANEQELKTIEIPSDACAQTNGHEKAQDGGDAIRQNVAKSTDGSEVSKMGHDEGEISNHSNRTSHRDSTNKDEKYVYATVDKSSKQNKKGPEVVYAEVDVISIAAGRPQESVTYAELADFKRDATHNDQKAPPSYHPTGYASVSAMPVRCHTK